MTGILKMIIIIFIMATLLSSATIAPQIPYIQKSGGLADSSWPCYKGDERRTGQSKYDTGNNTGKIKWRLKGLFSSPVVDVDGTIYVSGNENFYAIYPNGTVKWKVTIGSRGATPAIDRNGIIYAGFSNGNLYAFFRNGTIRWSYKTEDAIYSSPIIDKSGIIYFSSTDGYLYALYPNGTLKWKTYIGKNLVPSPSLDEVRNTLYIPYAGIYALNATTGQIKWYYHAREDIPYTAPIDKRGVIYFSTSYDGIYAINPNGSLRWQYNISELYLLTPPVIGKDGTIYVSGIQGSRNGNLTFYAITSDGDLKWKLEDVYVNQYESPAIGADGTLYFGSWHYRYFYALWSNGTIKWKTRIREAVSSPAIGPDGTLYIVAQTHGNFYLYAIGNVNENKKQPFLDLWDISVIVETCCAILIVTIWLWKRKNKRRIRGEA